LPAAPDSFRSARPQRSNTATIPTLLLRLWSWSSDPPDIFFNGHPRVSSPATRRLGPQSDHPLRSNAKLRMSGFVSPPSTRLRAAYRNFMYFSTCTTSNKLLINNGEHNRKVWRETNARLFGNDPLNKL
jgi:hypothetical protein